MPFKLLIGKLIIITAIIIYLKINNMSQPNLKFKHKRHVTLKTFNTLPNISSQQSIKKQASSNKQGKGSSNTKSKKHIKQKTKSRQATPDKGYLFSSLRQLPQKTKLKKKVSKVYYKQKSLKVIQQPQQESLTTSEDHWAKKLKYELPNGQYFGNQHQHPASQKIHSLSKEKNVSTQNEKQKLTMSLQKKIKQFRKMDSDHQQESSSMTSEISDKEMRRLKKIHQVQRWELMQDIIGIEQKLSSTKKVKKSKKNI